VAALAAAGTGEAVGQDAAFEVAAEFALDVSWHRSARRALAREFAPGCEVALRGAIEHSALGLAAAIGRGARGAQGALADMTILIGELRWRTGPLYSMWYGEAVHESCPVR